MLQNTSSPAVKNNKTQLCTKNCQVIRFFTNHIAFKSLATTIKSHYVLYFISNVSHLPAVNDRIERRVKKHQTPYIKFGIH